MDKRGKIRLLFFIFLALVSVTLYTSGELANNSNLKGDIGFENSPEIFTLKVGEEFNYDFNLGEGYYYSDDTDKFDIDRINGNVSFVPTKKEEFDVVVIGMKSPGDFVYRSFRFKVI